MKKAVVVGMLAAGLVHGIAFAQTSNVNQGAPTLGSAVQEEMSRREAHLAASVRSERDLYWHLITSSDSPLNLLPMSSRWEFIGSLVFTDKGLASFRYDVLQDELTRAEIYEVLSLFGVQHTARMIEGEQSDSMGTELVENNSALIQNSCLPRVYPGGPSCGDHQGYRCVSRATCRKDMNHICTDNC